MNLKLSDSLRQVSRLTVSVLPDFFYDRLVSVPSLDRLFKEAKAKAAAGGGSLRGYSQSEIRGGNAVNLAFCLASLSVKTTLYCIGDSHARYLLAERPENCKVRVIAGQPGFTVALESPLRGRMANVMISDVGGIVNFDGRALNRIDTTHLGKSDCIALTNWSANKRGNELARKVFSLPGRRARLNFLDPADLTGAEGRIKPLRRLVDQGLVDVISLNENETSIMMKVLSLGRLPKHYRAPDVIKASAKLHAVLHARIDVHTPIGSATAYNEEQVWVSSPGLVKGYATGAGDAWDAADIIGSLLRLLPRERLQFANAYAYLHITRRTRAPSLKGVERFLRGGMRFGVRSIHEREQPAR